MTIKQVAEMHGCHHATVRKAIKAERLKAKKVPFGIPGRLRYVWVVDCVSARKWKPGANSGRPPKRPENRREYSLQVAITGDQRAQLMREARTGETLPDVVRRRLFGDDGEMEEYLTQLE